jgi:uncharacterized protein (DUF2267 family)
MPMHVEALGGTSQQTEIGLNEVTERLGTNRPEQAYQALCAVLVRLRDRVGTDNAAQLSAQLPVLIRDLLRWLPSRRHTEQGRRM